MAEKADIPQSLAELTPAWLTRALRERGVLSEASVKGVETLVLGEGEGFVGLLARLSLTYDRAEPGAPKTMIAKLPTHVGENRAIGEMMGAYEREILFYENFADRLPIAKPKLYFSAMDNNPAAAKGPAIVRFLDRLPKWMLRLLLWLVLRFAGRIPRRYLLLIEDMAPNVVGDQVGGCDEACAEQVLRALARAQATLWKSPELDGKFWLQRGDIAPNMFHLTYLKSRPEFEATWGKHITPHVRNILRFLDSHGAELYRRFHDETPLTFVHGDFRLDNMFFDRDTGALASLFDFQGASIGPAAMDTAYFIAGSIAADVGEEVVDRLLRAYHAELVSAGVEDFSFETLLRDYDRALSLIFHRMVSVELLDLGDERGAALLEVWFERIAKRLTRIDVSTILPRAISA